MNEKDAAIASFEKQGQDQVRLWIASNQGSVFRTIRQRLSWAVEWLAQFEEASRLQSEASQAESLETAKSAKDAAWEAANAARAAAREAKTANMIATLALVAAVIAIAISILAAFLR